MPAAVYMQYVTSFAKTAVIVIVFIVKTAQGPTKSVSEDAHCSVTTNIIDPGQTPRNTIFVP